MLSLNFRISERYDVKVMKRFLFPGKGDWDWSKYIFCHHKNLKKYFGDKSDKRKVEIKKYIKKYYIKNSKELEAKKKFFERQWEKINDKFEKILCELLEMDVKKINFKITCFVSICPICPRDLKEKNFSIFYKQKGSDARLTIAHEILHFYYFYKWKKVFPKHSEKSFNGPHIIWHLSEILAVVLLNTKNLQKILKKKALPYEEYRTFKINNMFLINYFDKLYREHKGSFSNFLKKAYKEILEYKKEIMRL
jgi:hypothetical protein